MRDQIIRHFARCLNKVENFVFLFFVVMHVATPVLRNFTASEEQEGT